jgi:hypothetical protein
MQEAVFLDPSDIKARYNLGLCLAEFSIWKFHQAQEQISHNTDAVDMRQLDHAKNNLGAAEKYSSFGLSSHETQIIWRSFC